MSTRLSAESSKRSFVGVVITVIKHLSGTFCCKLVLFSAQILFSVNSCIAQL